MILNLFGQAFTKAYRKGWHEEWCAHMKRVHRKPWTKKDCMKEARKYSSRSSWEDGSTSYGAALKKGWVNDCCGHMKSKRV